MISINLKMSNNFIKVHKKPLLNQFLDSNLTNSQINFTNEKSSDLHFPKNYD